MEFSHFPICYILFSRWKDWRDKVAAELRQSVRSSKRIYIFYLQCSLTVFYVAVQQSEAADINVSKQASRHDKTGIFQSFKLTFVRKDFTITQKAPMDFTFKTLLKDNMLFFQYRFLKLTHQVKSLLQITCLAYCLDSVLNVRELGTGF